MSRGVAICHPKTALLLFASRTASSLTTTERHRDLQPDMLAESAFPAIDVDLLKPAGDVVQMAASCSAIAITQQDDAPDGLVVSL